MSVIKWVGGKTKIYENFRYLYEASTSTRLVDLFCGSLALPVMIQEKNCIFNDINNALINMYKVIRDSPEELLEVLKELNQVEMNCKEKFEEIRNEFNIIKFSENVDTVRYAGIFIYLNKRSFNGLYRENKKGYYNVPFRKYNNSIYSKESINKLSEYLRENNITFYNKNFEEFDVSMFNRDDLVYLDPPYYQGDKSNFTGYSQTPFHKKEQEKLLLFCNSLTERGIKFIMSNSPCPEIKEMYKKYNQYCFFIKRQMRCGKGKSKCIENEDEPNEMLIWNYSCIILAEDV